MRVVGVEFPWVEESFPPSFKQPGNLGVSVHAVVVFAVVVVMVMLSMHALHRGFVFRGSCLFTPLR